MVKFIKRFSDKIKDKVEETKLLTKYNAVGGTQLTLKKMYEIYFKAISGFESGKPSSVERWAWKVYVVPCIDKKYNMEARLRAKRILKEFKDEVNQEDVDWIKAELRPYFERSYKEQVKEVDDIVGDIDLLKVRSQVNSAKKFQQGGGLK